MIKNEIPESVIIFVTAYDSDNVIELINDTKADGYLGKPFELIELYEIL